MMRFARIHAAAVVALTASLGSTGCESPLEPSSVAGIYVLESVGRMPLPALIVESETVRTSLMADTIRLEADGSGNRTQTFEVSYLKESHRDGTSVSKGQFGYTLRGNTVEITFLCGPAENCPRSPHWEGDITPGELRLHGDPGPYLYRRIHR